MSMFVGGRTPGTRVRLTGIRGAPAFNGQCGVVAGKYDPASGRQSVKLDGGQTIAFRLECMEDVAPASAGGFGSALASAALALGEPSVADAAPSVAGAAPSVGDKVVVQFGPFPEMSGTVTSMDGGYVVVKDDRTGAITMFPQVGPTFRVMDTTTFAPPPRRPGWGRSSSFTPEYTRLVNQFGEDLENLTLKGLFEFFDKDGNGNLSVRELEEAVPLIEELMRRRDGVLTHIDLETIDEDGNGVINFSEFCEWGGPRLGLRLGVSLDSSACGIIGCPCHEYRPVSGSPKGPRKMRRKRTKISAVVGLMAKGVEAAFDVARSRPTKDICQCRHKKSAHLIMETSGSDEIPYPDDWKNSRGSFLELVSIPGMVPFFQNLLNQTYSGTWTRDRKKHNPTMPAVPKGFLVTSVLRAENSKNWREYLFKKSNLLTERASEGGSWTEIDDVKSNVHFKNLHEGAFPLSSACNEWYLYHGTSAEAAEDICRQDFKISFAGGSTGTLYGKGIYLAESITKADEYAKPGASGHFTVLLCRTLGGNVRYTDEVEPDAEELVRDCIEGPYGCVLGDREKCRGTYREFIFFDTEDVYPEYIIGYQRLY